MASRAEFTVLDAMARRRCVGPNVRRVAERVARDATSRSAVYSGRLAGAYRTEAGRDPATTWVVNDTPYARYVEYGTKRKPARPALGAAMAATGLPRWPRRRR